MFLGTSLTAGFGLEDPDAAYPSLIQEKVTASGMAYRVVNAGVSGDTSAGGLARLPAILRDPLTVLVVELGANDGLRGQETEALKGNLTEVARRTSETYPEATIVLVGMEAPPNLGPEYTAAFREVYTTVADESGAELVPFLLDGIAGERDMNQSDGIHPNVEGHRRAAENIWAVLAVILADRCSADDACPAT